METASCSLERLLADEVVERARAQRAVELVLAASTPGVWMRLGLAHARGRLAGRCGDQVLGRLALGAVEQLVGLGGL